MTETRRLQGLITIVQESRFRLQDGEGRGHLFVLHAGLKPDKLRQFQQSRTPVTVTYASRPDAGAITRAMEPNRDLLLR